MNWMIKTFNELTSDELYDILKLRVDVFVVEQNCPYPEIDGYDREAVHLFSKKGDQIVAYCRLIPPNVKFEEASIGRVITVLNERRVGVGTKMLDEALSYIAHKWENPNIKIEAQSHLQSFYGRCGFKTISDEFLEDGIPHVEMFFEGNSVK